MAFSFRISNLSSSDSALGLLQESYSFILETFFVSLSLELDVYVYIFIPRLFVLAPHDSNVAVYVTSQLTVLCVVFATAWLLTSWINTKIHNR